METVAEGLAFPEGPVVMADGSVIVVELASSRITRCWNGRKEVVCEIGGRPNGAAIGPDGALYVCNNGGLDLTRFQNARGPGCEGRIERVDLATGTFERLYDNCDGIALEAPNDLVFAADGTLWFTDLGKTHDGIRTASGLFACRRDGTAITAIDRHPISYNGVGLSPDGTTVYCADTHQARLYRYKAVPEAQRPQWVATAPGMSGSTASRSRRPETSASQRSIRAALRRSRWTGRRPSFDDRYTTNIAFGGEDMQDAWITLSASGRLIEVRWDEPGLRLNFNG
jgi:gluconolactonase